MLSSLVRIIPKSDEQEPDAEDIFTSALGLVFTDDAQNFFGDQDTLVAYRSRRLDKELLFCTADPLGEVERRKFAHYVWNSSILMAEHIGGKPDSLTWRAPDESNKKAFDENVQWWLNEEEQTTWNVTGERVLELGAGAGLAGIMALLMQAEEVVLSDYPAPTILETLRQNIAGNVPNGLQAEKRVQVQGHTWGELDTAFATAKTHHFTRVLAADCLWMSYEHANLVKSMSHFLSLDTKARVHVIAGFHTGRAKVASFFQDVLSATDLIIESIWECNTDGRRRAWDASRPEDDSGERKKWLIVAVLKRGVGG
ncbi:hypothetical protein NA57DRAFT_34803 [Rhizodiscina lignyota]|uniref:Nicotinamide N-methyltransferase n=1 Tax=Rhizodiscina lignyota TaxID=1504668 RepID=A0A9P4INI5_9PEZI|nr:hypothetical protein NA57DRAFT_34803 [Rhizodiscina lignyota]